MPRGPPWLSTPMAIYLLLFAFQCSFHVCHKDPDENKRLVESYAARWLPNSGSFTCYYNTANFNDVIIHKRYSKSDVVHSMLWPSLVLIACCVVFLSLETRRRKLTFCGRRTTGSEGSPDRRNTPEVSDARLLDSQVILRRNLLQNGLLDDGRIVCKLAANSDAMSCKAWKSYSSLEKLVTRKEEFPLRGHPERLDSKSRSFDRLDESKRLHNRLRADLENDRMRLSERTVEEEDLRRPLPHSLDSITPSTLKIQLDSTAEA